MKEIKVYGDLPEYGKYVLVYGICEIYGEYGFHVCEMNDLEDGMDFQQKGEFLWLTESGERIKNVTHWSELPDSPKK